MPQRVLFTKYKSYTRAPCFSRSLLAALVLARWLGIQCQGEVGDAVRSAPGQPAIAPAAHHYVEFAAEAVAAVTAAAQRVCDRHFPAGEP